MDQLSQLLLDARDGNQHALDAFVRRTQRDVWVMCRNLGDADNAEDLVQDVYARALRSLGGYRGEGTARNWLLSIARRTCADATRQRIRRRRHLSTKEPDELSYVDPDRALVDDLLAGLDPDRREAFVLTQLAGCGYEDAAAVLGCPVGTVRSRVSRARQQLLRVVADDPSEGTA
ncbi:MAG: sigma-70 family RNA polymerase sigma factor [Acidimicrobiales bacterium]